MNDERSVEREVLDIAGKFYIEGVYDEVLNQVDSARRGREWFYGTVDPAQDSVIQ